MDSAASRIFKARQYACERDKRVKVRRFEVELHGENATHAVAYEQGAWACDCEEHLLKGVCAHIMALEQILGDAVEPALDVAPSRMDATASRLLKARQYAEERDQRIKVHSFAVELQGDNSSHVIVYENSDWNCTCEEFRLRNVCAHVMAMEEILGATVEPAMVTIPMISALAMAA